MAQVMHTADYAGRSSGPGLIERLAQAFADYRAYRTTHDELAGLTDRDLDDIGVSRHSIDDVARESAYGR
jgi:uncharacterized protein YjiS (DUF1127 family)